MTVTMHFTTDNLHVNEGLKKKKKKNEISTNFEKHKVLRKKTRRQKVYTRKGEGALCSEVS